MKTSEDHLDTDAPTGRAFPKEVIEKFLPNVGKIKSPISDRAQHYKQRYNGANRLNPGKAKTKITDSSKYAFVVAWQECK